MISTHTCLSQSCIPNGTFLLLDGLWILWAHGNDDYYYYHGFEASDTGKKQHPGERRGGKYGTAGGQALLQRKTRCIYLGRELCVFSSSFLSWSDCEALDARIPTILFLFESACVFSSECNYKDDISTTIPQRYYILENCLHVYQLCIHGETFLFLGVAKT